MWMNNIIVGFVDDVLVKAAEKGGIWIRIGQAAVTFIDKHLFWGMADGDDVEQDVDVDAGVEESLAGGM